ncbi:MAG: hypothetical protein LBJ90_04980 [Treponema sp.]|jgi:hypothetical protein|nr:hypothetical protein [Treponema sp.]
MARGFAENPQFINRAGRPRKGKSLTELLEKELAKKKENGKTGRTELVEALIEMATVNKDLAALNYRWDRIDGRPAEKTDQAGGFPSKEALSILSAVFGNNKDTSGAGTRKEEDE